MSTIVNMFSRLINSLEKDYDNYYIFFLITWGLLFIPTGIFIYTLPKTIIGAIAAFIFGGAFFSTLLSGIITMFMAIFVFFRKHYLISKK